MWASGIAVLVYLALASFVPRGTYTELDLGSGRVRTTQFFGPFSSGTGLSDTWLTEASGAPWAPELWILTGRSRADALGTRINTNWGHVIATLRQMDVSIQSGMVGSLQAGVLAHEIQHELVALHDADTLDSQSLLNTLRVLCSALLASPTLEPQAIAELAESARAGEVSEATVEDWIAARTIIEEP